MPLRLTGAGMRKAKKKENGQYRPPTPPRWKGRESLDLAFELNQRTLKLLSDWAANREAAGWPLTLERELWSKLDAQAIARAARFPFVILDVHFLSEAWWREVIVGSKGAAASQAWSTAISQDLMSETLIFAWHTAKWDARVARMALGTVPAVATLIAALTPQQLATISREHSGALCLRWQDNSDFWTRLLFAARGGDEEVLAEIHLHAKLLLCGELILRSI
jgi:hypothetical protein